MGTGGICSRRRYDVFFSILGYIYVACWVSFDGDFVWRVGRSVISTVKKSAPVETSRSHGPLTISDE